jgi:hypothetical protein
MASLKQRPLITKLRLELNQLRKDTESFIRENEFNIEMQKQTTFSSKLLFRIKRVSKSIFSFFYKND